MQLGNLKSVIIGVGAAAAAIAITGAASGSGIGAVFNLGKTNTVNATSRLKGSTNHPMLSVTNNGTGTALSLQVAQGKPPFSVNSSTRIANLNASLLGGLGPSQFALGQLRSYGFSMSTATDNTKPLLSVPGFGTLNAECGPSGGGFARVRFQTGTHAMDEFTVALDDFGSSNGFSTFHFELAPNHTYFLIPATPGMGQGHWFRETFRYVAGLLSITYIATVDIMVNVGDTTCDFDASAVIGPGTSGP